MKNEKIHIWVPELIAREGGIQSYSMEMVEVALEILGPGRITVLSKTDQPGVLRQRFGGKIRTYATGNLPSFLRTPAFALVLVITAFVERPKLILATHANFSPVAAWLQRWAGIPAAVSAHGIEVWGLTAGRVRKALSQVQKVLPVSEYTKQRMEKEINLPGERFEVIPDTYDSSKFLSGLASAELKKRLGLEGRKVIYTLARLDPGERYKGIDEVLEVLPEICHEIPNLSYLIGGKGEDRERLEGKVHSLGLARQVIFAGYIPEVQKADYYRLADLFVMPGWGEGFGIVYLESAACGVPVLGSTLDASVEVIEKAEIGEAVNPKNPKELKEAIVRMLKSPVKGPFVKLAQFDQTAFRGRVRGLLESFEIR